MVTKLWTSMTKMWKSMITIIVLTLLCTNIEAAKQFNLTVGPKKNESGRFVYNGTFGREHCKICSLQAIMDSTYSYFQQQLCINNYNNFSAEVTQYEIDNKKYALCTSGDTPGCNSLPNISWTDSLYWYCDPGISFQNYSVYFSCALICDRTNKVERSYYCNEKLQWELEEVNSQQICHVPEKAPDSNQTELYVFVAVGIVMVLLCMLAFVFLCCWRCKNKKRKKEDEYGNMLEPGDAERLNPAIQEEPEYIPLMTLQDEPSNDSGNSTGSANSRESSITTESEHKSCSVQTDRNSGLIPQPSIKIMTCKNHNSQRSVPLQSSYYSIEHGSDYYVIPDCPGGISVTKFSVRCKDMGKIFRGHKCNGFMYEVTKVCEEDADFYVWNMELENGKQYDGNFQISVFQPEGFFSSANRREPVGEDSECNDHVHGSSIVNNQQVRAEVYEDPSFIPLSDDMFTHNNPDHRRDSGLSLGSLRSVARSNVGGAGGRAIGEDMAYSTSGYETQPSVERNREYFQELLGSNHGLNPDTIDNNSNDVSNSDCDNYREPRTNPVGCVAENVCEEFNRDAPDDDDDDDDQTAQKQFSGNGCDESSIPINGLHGELPSAGSERPLNFSTQGLNVPNPVSEEEFHRRVEFALQSRANTCGDRSNLSKLNHANLNTSNTSDKSESNHKNNSHLGNVNNIELNSAGNSDLGIVNNNELNRADNSDLGIVNNNELNPANISDLGIVNNNELNPADNSDLVIVNNNELDPSNNRDDLAFGHGHASEDDD